MIPLVRCPTCGDPLGEVAASFRVRAVAITMEVAREAGVDPTKLDISGSQVVLGRALDEVGITSICCRQATITNCDLIDHYGL